jgi:diacylglycerol kinase family enzyme
MRVWLILNRASRAVASDWEDKLTAAFGARGWAIAGTTDFPQEGLPDPARLDAIDIVAVAAGDGTINAVAKRFDDWPGLLLVLPGGTMNLLAKALHGSVDPVAIIAAIAEPPQTRRIPIIECGEHRALVGAIVGPGASWVHAREAVRHNRWARLGRAIRFAWLRSLSHAVHLRDGKRRSPGYRAVFVQPGEDALSIIRVRASGWADGVRLGFTYLTGSWQNARGIDTSSADTMTLAGRRPVFALFDGEPLHLPPDAVLRLGRSRLRFIAVVEASG